MELNYSEKLNKVLENGYANKIADIIPSLLKDFILQKSIYGDLYIHYSKMMSTETELVDQFNNSIDIDYDYMSDMIKYLTSVDVGQELTRVIMKSNPNDGSEHIMDFNSMLKEIISSGINGYVYDIIAPRELCSYDYNKGNVFDLMLTDLMPIDNINDDYRVRLEGAIVIDYNMGLNRKPIYHLLVSLPVIYNLTHNEIYNIVYRTIKFNLKEIHRLSEDKASRVSNIAACRCTNIIYKHRDIVTDVALTINIADGIKMECGVLGTGV